MKLISLAKIIIFITLLTFPVLLSAYDSLWIKTYGGTGTDIAYAVKQTSDSGYIVTGCKANSLWLLKLDRYGDTLWTRTYPGQSISKGYDVIEIDDGYAVLAVKDAEDAWMLILDEYGDTVWTNFYNLSFPYNIGLNHSSSIIHGLNNSFLLAGYEDVILVDSIGDSIWILGGNYGSVCINQDSNYINSHYMDCLFIRKFSYDSTILWDKFLVEWNMGFFSHFYHNSIKETHDGGFIMTGSWEGYHNPVCIYLVKADSAGDLVFGTYKINTNYSISEGGMSVIETYEGGYLLTAKIVSGEVCLYKTDSTGDSLWLREYGQGLGYCLEKTNDSAYVLVGILEGDLFIMKFDSLGNTGVEEPIISNPSPSNSILTYNQTERTFYLTVNTESPISLKIYDLQGRLVDIPISGTLSSGTYQIPFRSERSGIYFYHLESDYITETGKFMVVR
ncbi:MAG: hypothetical protein APR63_06160 [Desulfuromonas sp. SDB]|nr:MAG: hypothetical protein APR63_06160 [Desulfuromonas sp. SDB]